MKWLLAVALFVLTSACAHRNVVAAVPQPVDPFRDERIIQPEPEEITIKKEPPKSPAQKLADENREMQEAFVVLKSLKPAENDVCKQYERYVSAKYLWDSAHVATIRTYEPANPEFMKAYGFELSRLKSEYAKGLAHAETGAMRSGKKFHCDIESSITLNGGRYQVLNYAAETPGWISVLLGELSLENTDLIFADGLPSYDENRKAQLSLVRAWITDWKDSGKKGSDWFVSYWANAIIKDYSIHLDEAGLSYEEAGRFLFER